MNPTPSPEDSPIPLYLSYPWLLSVVIGRWRHQPQAQAPGETERGGSMDRWWPRLETIRTTRVVGSAALMHWLAELPARLQAALAS
jgi:hypothetical protein